MSTPSKTVRNLKRRLLSLREELLAAEQTGGDAEATVELDQTRVGRLSRMDALQAQAMSKETGRRRRLYLRRIDAALQRIADDEYGACLACGDEIPLGRLEIDPAAEWCVNCADEEERKAP